MRQQKALLAIFGVAFVLVAGLLVYGCGRSGGEGEEHEHGGETMEEGEHAHEAEEPSGEEPLAPSGTVQDGVRVVEVTARKFEFDPATIVVNEGEKVRLKITSEDVTHGFGLGDYDIDRQLPPKETQTVEFTADKPGRHHFHCSVYCGEGHGKMRGTLVVLRDEVGTAEESHHEGETEGHEHAN